MTAIDWTQPVETTEDPPRPVRVLCTDAPGDYPTICLIESLLWRFQVDGGGVLGLHLRNVAPPKPKPVLHEVWVSLYSHGGAAVGREENTHPAKGYEPVECRRIAWMSDGSQAEDERIVPEELGGGSWKETAEVAIREREDWKRRADRTGEEG